TPQQNGVTERKNKTLIEEARTMLADSLLPTVFCAKAVNTACYVLIRVLVTKPHNKTPYELIIGRLPSISIMRPFGCLVTFLNTLDPLGKFNGKAEEGFLVGETYKTDTADDDADETPIQKPASENEQSLKNVLDKIMDQEKEASKKSDAVRKNTPVNAASTPRTSNDAGPSFVPLGGSFPLNVNDLPDDPLMPDLEDTVEVQNTGIFGSAFDDEYLDTYIHPKDQIIGDPKSAVEAMQEELLQFKIQKVWILVDLPYGKKAIGTKWVYRNKKDKRGIVTVVANSTTEAEYIAASHCCGQVLWIQNQMLDYGYNFIRQRFMLINESAICVVKNPVTLSKTKHIEIRHHFIRDSYEKKLIEMVKIHTDYNVADLLTKAFDVTRFQFLIASIGLELQGYLINDGYADLVRMLVTLLILLMFHMIGLHHITNGHQFTQDNRQERMAMIRQTTTGKEFSNPLMGSCLEKSDENAEFHQIVDFLSTCSINYALTVSPTIYASYIEQFWNTATSKIINSVKQIHAIVDGKAVLYRIISEK
ncbi:putative ribonuclease H-like domain-containing protein, partial [Tanacetum coccineum]